MYSLGTACASIACACFSLSILYAHLMRIVNILYKKFSFTSAASDTAIRTNKKRTDKISFLLAFFVCIEKSLEAIQDKDSARVDMLQCVARDNVCSARDMLLFDTLFGRINFTRAKIACIRFLWQIAI